MEDHFQRFRDERDAEEEHGHRIGTNTQSVQYSACIFRESERSLRWFVANIACDFHHVDCKDRDKGEQEDEVDDPKGNQDPVFVGVLAVHGFVGAVVRSRNVAESPQIAILYLTPLYRQTNVET